MALEALTVVVCTIFLCWYLFSKRNRLPNPHPATRHPPCLTALPVVGSLTFLKSDPSDIAQNFMEKSKSLGSVFALYFGSQYVVVLNGADAIRDALLKKSSHFAGRASLYLEQYYLNTKLKGLFFAPTDEAFRRKRQFYLSILKRFGFGQRIMETRINANVEDLIREVENIRGRSFDPEPMIQRSIVSILSSIMLGQRYSHGHSSLLAVCNVLREFMWSFVLQLDFLPLLRFVPPFRGRVGVAIAVHERLMRTLDEMLSGAMEMTAGEVDSNVNDCFIRHYDASTKSSDTNVPTTLTAELDDTKLPPPDQLDREELLYTLRDMLGGSADVSFVVRWFLIMMANHREAQTRMRAEIDSVVGRDRLPSLDDERSMLYSQAVVLEVLRKHTSAPLTTFHSATCDTAVGDLFIPAGTTVIVNLYSVFMDSTVWQDPSAFRPERFLDEDGKLNGKDRVIAFSLGKRSCMGESLARQMLFLYMTGIVQNFDIRPPEKEQQITHETNITAINEPTPFDVRLVPRLD